jgi:hypothetical protein
MKNCCDVLCGDQLLIQFVSETFAKERETNKNRKQLKNKKNLKGKDL